MHSSPRAPSVVSRTCKLSPAGQSRASSFEQCALPRTDSPSLHSCPASGSASSFLLASALSLHEPLRAPGAEDARCVRPTSATRTNDVYPSAPYVPGSLESLSRLGTPRKDPWSSRCMTEGTSVFTTPEPLRPHHPLAMIPPNTNLVPIASRLWVTSMGLLDPRCSRR